MLSAFLQLECVLRRESRPSGQLPAPSSPRPAEGPAARGCLSRGPGSGGEAWAGGQPRACGKGEAPPSEQPHSVRATQNCPRCSLGCGSHSAGEFSKGSSPEALAGHRVLTSLPLCPQATDSLPGDFGDPHPPLLLPVHSEPSGDQGWLGISTLVLTTAPGWLQGLQFPPLNR